jgi:hypothetical protein
MGKNPREQEDYIRLLELMSVISEGWGKTIHDINNYIGKGWDVEDAGKAMHELRHLQSPLNELEALLEVNKRRGEAVEK